MKSQAVQKGSRLPTFEEPNFSRTFPILNSSNILVCSHLYRLLVFVLAFCFCGPQVFAFQLKTDAFQPEEEIPINFTCDGKNQLPSLSWQNPPSNTKSFVLIAEDPDAPMGTWVHWVVYDIPSSTLQLAEGIPFLETLPDGSKQGMTDFGRPGYGGPCPPPGKAHRYYFKLYALDSLLNLPLKQTKADLIRSMQGHILAAAQLMGKYKRKE